MKNIFIVMILAGLSFAGFTKLTKTETFTVDTNASTIKWYAEKVGGKHNGTIQISNGMIVHDAGKYSGHIEIDMSTIKNTDIDDEKSKAKLETHLKSPDFFDVQKYPKSKFVIRSIFPLRDSLDKTISHRITGDLTIKDKTKQIAFNAGVSVSNGRLACIGSTMIDRTEFDVQYGSKKFFKDIGDKMIHDEFKLEFNVIAVVNNE